MIARIGARCDALAAEAGTSGDLRSGPVLLLADLLQPVDGLAVELLLDCDVAYGRGRRGPVPVLLAGREPDHIAGPDLLDRPAFALRPAAAGRHDQGLAERVGVPSGPRAGLEGDQGAGDAGRIRCLEQGI